MKYRKLKITLKNGYVTKNWISAIPENGRDIGWGLESSDFKHVLDSVPSIISTLSRNNEIKFLVETPYHCHLSPNPKENFYFIVNEIVSIEELELVDSNIEEGKKITLRIK